MFTFKDQLLFKQTLYEINPPEEGFEPMSTCSTSNSLIHSATLAKNMTKK